MAEQHSTPGYPFAGSFFLATHYIPTRTPVMQSAIGLSREALFPPLLPAGQYYSSIILQPSGHMETMQVQRERLQLRESNDHERDQLMLYYRDLQVLVDAVGRALGFSASN